MERIKNIRSLHISSYPNVPDFNIPRVIAPLENLRELWIDAPLAPKASSLLPTGTPAQTVPQPVASTDLKKEMAGELPAKLRKVTISGKGFTQIADNILDVSKTSP